MFEMTLQYSDKCRKSHNVKTNMSIVSLSQKIQSSDWPKWNLCFKTLRNFSPFVNLYSSFRTGQQTSCRYVNCSTAPSESSTIFGQAWEEMKTLWAAYVVPFSTRFWAEPLSRVRANAARATELTLHGVARIWTWRDTTLVLLTSNCAVLKVDFIYKRPAQAMNLYYV